MTRLAALYRLGLGLSYIASCRVHFLDAIQRANEELVGEWR